MIRSHNYDYEFKIENTNLPYINVYKGDIIQQQDKKQTIHKTNAFLRLNPVM